MAVKEGTPAPDFELKDQIGNLHKLSDYRDKNVVLYFYPKDDTPGCTTEACSFRDNYEVFTAAGVIVLGISPDTVKSHQKFQQKHDLPFILLADENHEVCELYRVWGLKKFMGREYNGVFRTTFIIDGDGKISKVYENVKPTDHAVDILKFLNA